MKISACMIVKNEEAMIGNCLKSIESWVDEIVIIDTGSTDNTVKIAESFGSKVKVYHEEWQNDFSLHRNQSIEKATGEWLFIIDADEEVAKSNGEAMRALLLDDVETDVITVEVDNVYGKDKVVRSKLWNAMRFFRSSSGMRYRGFVHNAPKIKAGSKVRMTEFKIVHYGYGLEDTSKMAEKYERMVSMCKSNLDKNPDSPMAHLYYARAIKVKDGKFNLPMVDEMKSVLEKGIALCGGKNGIEDAYIQLLYTAGMIYYSVGEHKRSAVLAHEALNCKRDYLDALLLLGYAYTYGINMDEGEKWFLRYLEERKVYSRNNGLDALVIENVNAKADVYRSLIDIEERRASFGPGVSGSFEHGANYYDGVYASGYNTDRYLPIYRNVVSKISQNGSSVLEIGCGTGTLAKMIESIPKDYIGYDFSSEAIRKAKGLGVKRVYRGDVYDRNLYNKGDFNTVVALEVLEHVDDIDVLSRIPAGTKLILSVPNFQDVSHMRTYKSPDEIASRWQALVDIETVDPFDMGGDNRIFLCHGTKIGV